MRLVLTYFNARSALLASGRGGLRELDTRAPGGFKLGEVRDLGGYFD